MFRNSNINRKISAIAWLRGCTPFWLPGATALFKAIRMRDMRASLMAAFCRRLGNAHPIQPRWVSNAHACLYIEVHGHSLAWGLSNYHGGRELARAGATMPLTRLSLVPLCRRVGERMPIRSWCAFGRVMKSLRRALHGSVRGRPRTPPNFGEPCDHVGVPVSRST